MRTPRTTATQAARGSTSGNSAGNVPPEVLFAALSDASRLRLLGMLRRGETCVCDLVDGMEAPQPAVSRHLAVLRRAGLVRARREGIWMHYALTEPAHGLHRALLACLDACATLEPTFAADERRVARARKTRGCCD